MSSATELSVHDQQVFAAIFGGGEAVPAPTKRVEVDVDLRPDPRLETGVVNKLVEREKKAIRDIETGGRDQYASALAELDDIIREYPEYASAYNNRAQLRRLMDPDADVIGDLEKAVSLAEPPVAGRGMTVRVSKMQASVLQSAYMQLANIYMGRSRSSSDETIVWESESKASDAFSRAGEYGNEIATALAVRVNPYAKLCGNIVQEALARERAEFV